MEKEKKIVEEFDYEVTLKINAKHEVYGEFKVKGESEKDIEEKFNFCKNLISKNL